MSDLGQLKRDKFFELLNQRESGYSVNETKPSDPRWKQLRGHLTEEYEKRGIIDASQLDDDGLLPDHYVDQSVYFLVGHTPDSEKPPTGARLIFPDPYQGLESLQAHIDQLDTEAQEKLRQFYQQDPSSVAELATNYFDVEQESPFALVALYKEMAQYSKVHGVRAWVIGLRPDKAEEYERLLGEVMEPAGEKVDLGTLKKPFKPYVIDVSRLYELLFRGTQQMGGLALSHQDVA